MLIHPKVERIEGWKTVIEYADVQTARYICKGVRLRHITQRYVEYTMFNAQVEVSFLDKGILIRATRRFTYPVNDMLKPVPYTDNHTIIDQRYPNQHSYNAESSHVAKNVSRSAQSKICPSTNLPNGSCQNEFSVASAVLVIPRRTYLPIAFPVHCC